MSRRQQHSAPNHDDLASGVMPQSRQQERRQGMRWPFENSPTWRTARGIAYRRALLGHLTDAARGIWSAWFVALLLVVLLKLRQIVPEAYLDPGKALPRSILLQASDYLNAKLGPSGYLFVLLAAGVLSLAVIVVRAAVLPTYWRDYCMRPGDAASVRRGIGALRKTRPAWLLAWRRAEDATHLLRAAIADNPRPKMWGGNDDASPERVVAALPRLPYVVTPPGQGNGSLFSQEMHLPSDAELVHRSRTAILAAVVTALADASDEFTIGRGEHEFTDAVFACQMLDDHTQLWLTCAVYQTGEVLGIDVRVHGYWWAPKGYAATGKYYMGDIESFKGPWLRRLRGVWSPFTSVVLFLFLMPPLMAGIWFWPVAGYGLLFVLAGWAVVELGSFAKFAASQFLKLVHRSEDAREFLQSYSPSYGETADLRLLTDHREDRRVQIETPGEELNHEVMMKRLAAAQSPAKSKPKFLASEDPNRTALTTEARARADLITARFMAVAKATVEPMFK